jgi:hypothetical protein
MIQTDNERYVNNDPLNTLASFTAITDKIQPLQSSSHNQLR